MNAFTVRIAFTAIVFFFMYYFCVTCMCSPFFFTPDLPGTRKNAAIEVTHLFGGNV